MLRRERRVALEGETEAQRRRDLLSARLGPRVGSDFYHLVTVEAVDAFEVEDYIHG